MAPVILHPWFKVNKWEVLGLSCSARDAITNASSEPCKELSTPSFLRLLQNHIQNVHWTESYSLSILGFLNNLLGCYWRGGDLV